MCNLIETLIQRRERRMGSENAGWERGRDRGGRRRGEEEQDTARVGAEVANQDNLENSKETGREAQDTQG